MCIKYFSMAGLKIFLTVVVLLNTKDEAFSCPTRSHKGDSFPCPPSLSDSTSNPHHSSATTIPCKTASGSSSGSLKLPSSLTLPTKTILTPDTLLPSPAASFLPPTPNVYSNNYLDLVNILTKMLPSSPSNVALSVPQIPLANQLTLPYLPALNIVRGPVKIPKPHITHSSHAKLSGSSPCSSGTLPGLPNGLVPPLIAAPIPSLEFPFTAPTLNVTSCFNVSAGDDTEHSNALQKPSSPTDSPSDVPKLVPLSRLCAQFSPASHNSPAPVSDSTSRNQSLSNPPSDANDRLPSSTSPGLRPCDPSSSTAPKVPGAVPEPPLGELPAPDAASICSREPTTARPTTEPAPPSTSNPSTVRGGRRKPSSTVTNFFHRKHLPSTPAPRPRPSALSPPCPKTALDAASGMKPARKGTPLGCVPSPGPGALPRPASITLLPVAVPPPTSNATVPSGYNPAFMQLLVNRLISNPNSPLSLSLPCLRPSFNVTPGVFPPSRNNTSQTSTLNRPLCDLNTNTSSDKPTASTPAPGSNTTTAPSTSLCDNPPIANTLCKLLVSSFATSKTHFPPCPPPSNINLTSLFNSTTSVASV